MFQQHAEDASDRLARNLPLHGNLETLSHQLDNQGNLDHWARQGSAENSAPLGNLGSFVPLMLTSLVVATISGTAAYTSLMADPPGEQKTKKISDTHDIRPQLLLQHPLAISWDCFCSNFSKICDEDTFSFAVVDCPAGWSQLWTKCFYLAPTSAASW